MLGVEQLESSASKALLLAGSEVPRVLFIFELGLLLLRDDCCRCQKWDSNPRLQGRLRPERSALDRSAILTAGLGSRPLASQASGAHARAQMRTGREGAPGLARGRPHLGAQAAGFARPTEACSASPGASASTWRRC